MSLFGSSRDDRRRRTIAEDYATAQAPATAAASRPAGKSPRYTPAARPENQRRISDLAPHRGWTLALAYLLGVTAVAGLLAGYAASADVAPQSASIARLLDASQGASLAGWLSSLMLGWAAGASLLVYSIRRHRVDDYRGRYRLWLWSAAAWLVMSVDAVANLHTPFAQLMTLATRWSMGPDGAVWWIGVWGLIVGILAMRLTLEVRECRVAAASLVVAFACWTVALAVDFSWLRVGPDPALIAAAGRLLGQVHLLLAIGIYTRHVLLDAQGLLAARPVKAPREKPEKKSAANSDSDSKTIRVDSAHRAPDKPHSQPASRPSYTSASTSFTPNRSASANDSGDDDSYSQYDDDSDDEDSSNRKLSKAERKRLRKQMRRQQRDDEE